MNYDRRIKLQIGTKLYDAATASVKAKGTFTYIDKQEGGGKFTCRIVDAKRVEGDWVMFFCDVIKVGS